MTATTVRIRRLVFDGVEPSGRAEAAAAFEGELTRLLLRWPVGVEPGPGDPVRPRPGVVGPAPAPGSPAAIGERVALAVHAAILQRGTS